MAVESLTERLRMADADIRRERDRADKALADVRTAESERDAARAEATAAQRRAADLERTIEAARAHGLLGRLRTAWRGGVE